MTTLLIPRHLFVTIINALPKDTWGAYAHPEGIELTHYPPGAAGDRTEAYSGAWG